MANPATAIEEAIGANLDGWKPADGKELYAFFKALPDVLDKLRSSFADLIRNVDDSGELENVVSDDLDQLDSCLGNGHDAADNLHQNFYNHYKFFLDGNTE